MLACCRSVFTTALPTAAMLAVLAGLAGLAQPRRSSAAELKPLAERLAQMPVTFTAHRGRDKMINGFSVHGRDKSLYFNYEGVIFSLANPELRGAPSRRAIGLDRRAAQAGAFRSPVTDLDVPAQDLFAPSPAKGTAARWNVRLDFLGARSKVQMEGLDQTPAVVSYLRGAPEKWERGIPTFNGIRYRELWKGIDLVYRGTVSELKYEFVVQPGSDPRKIRLAYRGAESVRLAESGDLEVTTPLGSFSDHAPVAYQEIDGKRVPVPARYDLAGTEYGFTLGDYDPSRPLIIDPAVFIYVGYLGGEGDDEAYGVAVDGDGFAYVAGTTDSPEDSFPAQVGPDLTYEGGAAIGVDAFVAKVRADGTGLVYAGYLGGEADDWAYSVALGPDNTPYLAGWTNSSEATFPVVTGPQTHYNGRRDAWIAHLTADGTGLQYCGYLGGNQTDIAFDLAVGSDHIARIVGLTFSDESSFPVVNGPDMTFNSPAGVSDAFLAAISPGGGDIDYCTYFGGEETDEAYGVALDGADNIYVSGFTTSDQTTFPVTVGPDLTFNGFVGVSGDAFVLKLRGNGSGLDYCGYLGGSDSDIAVGVEVDSQGRAILGGNTNSAPATFPEVVGPDLTFNGLTDAWVARVNAAGTGLDYCGYLGGLGNEQCLGLALGPDGAPFLVGHTSSTERSFPARVGPDLKLNFRQGGWIAKVGPSGAALDYAGYLEGAGGTLATNVAVDTTGSAFVVGTTLARQDSFPARIGPDLPLSGDGTTADAFIARIGAFTGGKPGSGRLRVSPARLSFGSIRAGANRKRTVTLQNTGTGNLTVNVPPLAGAFAVTPNGDIVLPRRGRATLTLTLTPTSPGPIYGGLTLTSDDPAAPLVQIPLQGRSL